MAFSVEVMMATMHRKGISEMDLSHRNVSTDILLINQCDKNESLKEGRARMICTTDRGSSNSRNLALKNASGDIMLVADDDVVFKKDYESIICKTFDDNPDADIITFQIETPDGFPFKDNYPREMVRHNYRSVLRCASIEIAFRKDKVRDAGLSWDTKFGLGSEYRIHDEVVFLVDALKAGLHLVYCPIPIVIHPPESSGTDYCDSLLKSKGAAFRRMFGVAGFVLIPAFSLKKYSEYKEQYTLMGCLSLMTRGFLGFKGGA